MEAVLSAKRATLHDTPSGAGGVEKGFSVNNRAVRNQVIKNNESTK